MAPHPPTPNDVTLLKMLADMGSLDAGVVESRMHLFVTTMAKSSGPGRYFLERARAYGWATKDIRRDGARTRAHYLITDKGRREAQQYIDPPPLPSANGHQTLS